ncbi:hypothetical protein ACFQY9_04955 [Microvirga aerilata]|uniref:hypothetical protein n=1 Tax=Microvirga aerilata TaxID=670292 RepID=UPI00362F64D0
MTLLLALIAPFLLLALGAAFSYLYAWTIERRFPPTGRFIEVEGAGCITVTRALPTVRRAAPS